MKMRITSTLIKILVSDEVHQVRATESSWYTFTFTMIAVTGLCLSLGQIPSHIYKKFFCFKLTPVTACAKKVCIAGQTQLAKSRKDKQPYYPAFY